MPTKRLKCTCKPVSSHASRTAAWAIDSFGSTSPPGKHQTSKSSRLVSKILSSTIMAMFTPRLAMWFFLCLVSRCRFRQMNNGGGYGQPFHGFHFKPDIHVGHMLTRFGNMTQQGHDQ